VHYSNVKNLKWADKEHTSIDLECNFSHLGNEVVPFTANPNDVMEYSVDLFNRCVAGEFGEIAEYVEPVIILTYEDKRRREYLPIAEQLDMLYWDKINNTNLWQEYIDAIKSKYPKE
jgi:hypothetical protein